MKAIALLFLLTASALHAQNPQAGTYRGGFHFYDGATATGAPYASRRLEFTVETDGTITNVINGVTNTEGTMTGSTTAGGAATFTLVGTGLTSGAFTSATGTFSAQASFPAAPGHTMGITQRASAQLVYGLLPQWQVSASGTGFLPSTPYTVSMTTSPTHFCALLWEGNTAGWSTLMSTNGDTWTKHPILPTFMAGQRSYPSPIRWVHDRYLFAVQVSSSTTINRIFSSPDGLNWTTSDTGTLPRLVFEWGYFGGTFYGLLNKAFGITTLDAITSTDGATWTQTTLASSADDHPAKFAASASRALISVNQSHTYFTATAGAGPWSSATFPGVNQSGIFRLAYGNSLFGGVLGAANVGSDPSLQLSSDGLAWTSAVPGAPITPDDVNFYSPFRLLTGHSGGFYGVTDYFHGRLLRSTNGHHWSRVARLPVGRSMLWNQDLHTMNGVVVATAQMDGTSATSIVSVHPDAGAGLPAVSIPFVTSEPLDLNKPAGTFSSLSAAAIGGGLRMSYQWKKGADILAGKTQPSLSWTSPTVADSGAYTLEITNAAGTTVTRTANVTFTASVPPVITSYPASQNVIEGNGGNAFALAISATGTAGTFTYQWRKNGQNIVGATIATYSFPSATAAASGSYDCVVTWSGGSLTHPPSQITFVPLTGMAATAGPAFRVVAPGASVFFQANVAGHGTLTYQWQKDGAPIANAAAPNLVSGATTVNMNVNPAQAGVFRCLVTSSTGASLLGPPIIVTVATPPAHNLLGKPLTKIADRNTLRPDLAGNAVGTITSVRFRDDTALFTALNAATGKEYLYRWNDGTLTAIATPTIAGDGGLFLTGVARPYTEPSGGSFFFIGYHSVATNVAQVLYRWSGGMLSKTAKQDEAAPGGGTYGPFAVLAARNDVLFFTSVVTLPDTTTEARVFQRAADGSVGVFLTPATTLPGGTHALSEGLANFDGSTLLMPVYDSSPVTASSYSMMLRRTADGTLSRLFDINTLIPGTSALMTNIGAADVEGGRIFAGSLVTYEAVFDADGTPRSGRQGSFNVTACDAEAWLASSGRSVTYRKDSLALTVVDTAQTLDGFTPTTVIAEAHGNEAAFLATNASNSSVLLALDTAATAVPLITYQPVSRTLDAGASVSFTALASGDGITWQWNKDGSPIPGATLNILTITGITAANAAGYTATATNSLGSANSNPAVLTLLTDGTHAPQFITQPADQQFLPGKSVIVSSVIDAGASAVTYSWTKNGQAFSTSTTSASLVLSNATAAAAGTYQLSVSSSYGSAVSRAVIISVFDPNPPAAPFAISNPVLTGGNYTFTTPVLSSGKTYLFQSSRTLAAGTWATVQTLTGGGATQNISVPYDAAVPGCFYRIAEQ